MVCAGVSVLFITVSGWDFAKYAVFVVLRCVLPPASLSL
jgi:hypothetical protein